MSYQACMTCVYMHGAHALSNFGMPMYFRWLVYMQADQNLGKITASHFGVLITQNANMNMPNMILIAELNKNLPDCKGGLVMRTPRSFLCLLVSNKAPEVGQNFMLHLFHVVIIKLNQSNYNST